LPLATLILKADESRVIGTKRPAARQRNKSPPEKRIDFSREGAGGGLGNLRFVTIFLNKIMAKSFWTKIKKPILALAPLAGISDSAFRQTCQSFGADVLYSEMTSIDGLYYDGKNTIALLARGKKEKPVVLQLFGKRPELVEKAVARVEEAGFDGIDINFGCPAKKVVAHEGGVTLLRDLNLCHELVQAVCEATKLPVSVKTRVSINSKDGKKKITVFDFLDKIKKLPVAAIMIHGRTYEQGFSGEVDYEAMRKVKAAFKGIVLGNGGLNSPEDVDLMINKTGVDGVGLARGLYGKPWLFKQVKDYLENGEYKEFTLAQIKKAALKHAEFDLAMKGDFGLVEMRKHLCWYFRGFPNASEWRQRLVTFKTLDELNEIFKKMK
jgi:tRNA-dihydrouridine synthase B